MAKAALEQKAMTVVPAYMVEQNRPYSAVDVYTNLRQEFGKPLVVKALEAGVAKGILKEKPIGKQKIFYADQEQFEAFDDGALKEYDEKVTAASALLDSLTTEWRQLHTELKGMSGAESTPRLAAIVKELTAEVTDMEVRVKSLESNQCSDLKEKGKTVMQNEKKMESMCNKRKRQVKDMVNQIRDGCPLPKKQLFDSIGLELEAGEM